MSKSKTALAGLSSVKLALLAKQARAQSEAILRADPIAVIGMACRVPGGGDTPEQYWQLLRDGVDAVREVPADRWHAASWHDPDLATVGKTITTHGGFLKSVDGFDADFFGILPREAERMDPQQRLFLEVAIEALDAAGLPHQRLRGSRTGAFVASYHNDYSQLQYSDVEAIDARTLTGTLHSVLVNRLSHLLDLHGPSISVDTACSSSLVAVHLACQSLRTGESDVALAGGVSLILTPDLMVSMSKVGFMAPDGRCKTFDESADGFGRGEGCGIVVLKRLSDAIADGDRVHAVIRGSAVNQDGHSTLLASPHGPAQEALIREALANAQLEPERIGFIETHGTGTALGDPIEVEAIAATVGRSPSSAPCWLGSAKANLGHLEAAAGIVGLIKVVLVLQRNAIPPQVHFTRLNPHISLGGTRLSIPTAVTPWPSGGVPRCAGVSSFGVGGTNAHVILEEAPTLPSMANGAAPSGSRILTLSAQSDGARRELAESWTHFLSDTTSALDELTLTATGHRSHYDYRLAVVGDSKETMRAHLLDYLGGGSPSAVVEGHASTAPRVAFVFSGQGPQWYAMGRDLLAAEPVFRDVIADCDARIRELAGWSLLEELGRSEAENRFDQTEVAQPALFAVQVALAALWKSWGVVPDGVIGHSVGEVAALHAAGVLSLADAIRIVVHRGRIMQEATGRGRMAAVELSVPDAEALLRPFGSRLSVAAVNAPRSLVLSGENEALEEVLATLTARGVSHRMLPVQYAFHSAQMAPCEQTLTRELRGIRPGAPGVPVFSTVTGGLVTEDSFDAAYFGRNVRATVRFADAVRAAAAEDFRVFVEIGPHPVLTASLRDCLAESAPDGKVIPTLRRGRPDRDALLQAAAAMYAAGSSLKWDAIHHLAGTVVPLPTYPWQRKRLWIRPSPHRESAHAVATTHPLLGSRLLVAGERVHVWQGDGDMAGWLADHRIFGQVVLPATAVFECLVAASVGADPTCTEITGFTISRPLLVSSSPDERARWQVVATHSRSGEIDLEFYEGRANGDTWQCVASAVGSVPASLPSPMPPMSAASIAIPSEVIYGRFDHLGVSFGPTFRNLREIRRQSSAAEAWIEASSLDVHAPFVVMHPALLDAALQLCSIAAGPDTQEDLPARVFLPIGIDRIVRQRPPVARMRLRADRREAGEGTLCVDVSIESPEGDVIARLEGVRFAGAQRSSFERGEDDLYELTWKPSVLDQGARGEASGVWLICCDRTGVGEAVARQLTVAGARVYRAFAGDGFARRSPDTFTLDPCDPQQVRRFVAEVSERTTEPIRGAVHLFSLDDPPIGDRLPAGEGNDAITPASAMHLLQALAGARLGVSFETWLVSCGARVISGDERPRTMRPQSAALIGLANVVAVEHPELRVRLLDLDPHTMKEAAREVLREIRAASGDRIVALRQGQRSIPALARKRLVSALPANAGALRMRLVRPGTLDGIELERSETASPGPDEVRLRVLACGLNFRDVLVTLGMYPGAAPPLGAECAGIVTEVGSAVTAFSVGDRVFGLAPGSMGTEVVVPAAFVAPAPAGVGLDAAAGMPVAFLTAHYGLHHLARLQRGERVLIHAGAGGVGIAAVQLARRCGAEVFATAGSPRKREWLRALGVTHVMDSRTDAFANEILAATDGAGVHVVLNSLAGDFIGAGFRVLAPGGRFLELGKRGVLAPEQAHVLRPDVSYHVYDLSAEAHACPSIVRPMLDEVSHSLSSGSLEPLPITTFGMTEGSEAFRFMAQARHIGKVVLRARREDDPLVVPDAAYWVTGGFGALGMETALWLTRSGARHLILSGRRPPAPSALERIEGMRRAGVTVHLALGDVADRKHVREVLDRIDREGVALRGVVHAAGIVRDAVFVNQRWDESRDVLRSKARSAWTLHEETRDRSLDFFILYSAAGAWLGAAGQGLYPAANLELDALAEVRRAQGLPALSVAWGAWRGLGMAATGRAAETWESRGLGSIAPEWGFARLEQLLRADAVCGFVLPIEWNRYLAQLPEGLSRDFFSAVAPVPTRATVLPPAPQNKPIFAGEVRSMPASQRGAAMTAHVRASALRVLGRDDTTTISERTPLKEAGLDSLMAVELRNSLVRSLGVTLPATVVFDYPTLDVLSSYLLRTLGLDTAVAPAPVPEQSIGADVAALSDEEAEAELLAELEVGARGSSHV